MCGIASVSDLWWWWNLTAIRRICQLIIPGQGKWCGLLGRDTEYIIGWKCVRQIGADIILVDVCMEEIMRRCEG